MAKVRLWRPRKMSWVLTVLPLTMLPVYLATPWAMAESPPAFRAAAMSLPAVCSDGQTDRRLWGVWQMETYVIDKVDRPAHGVIIIQTGWLAADIIYFGEDGKPLGANANAGPICTMDGNVVINQTVQLHYRPNTSADDVLAEGRIERIGYHRSGDTLVLTFPSGNRYIARRKPVS
jgi:hypothetical protein